MQDTQATAEPAQGTAVPGPAAAAGQPQPLQAPASPSPIHQVLALPHLVSRIVSHLRNLHTRRDQDEYADVCAADPDMLACALVGSLWRFAAQKVLHERLIFFKGKSVRLWLDALGDEETARYPTHTLELWDKLPFKPEVVEGDGAKWSYADIGRLLSKVRGVEHLEIYFVFQEEVPGDWLTHPNLATLTKLTMTCPVSTPTKPLPFKLDDLNLIDVARDHVKRDWISTFESLGSSPALRNLHELRLDAFPTAAEHLLRLVPCASSLRELHLSVLRPSPHAWQTYVFAAACTSLVELHVNYILGWGAEVLSCFPSGPPLVVVGSISGAVGHGHPHVRQQGLETCPIRVLIDTLWRREPGKLKRLLVQRMRYTTHDYGGDLAQLEAMRGVKSIVGTETSMTDDEQRHLHRLVELSQRDADWKAQHPIKQLEEIA